jgi:hypothetical protein
VGGCRRAPATPSPPFHVCVRLRMGVFMSDGPLASSGTRRCCTKSSMCRACLCTLTPEVAAGRLQWTWRLAARLQRHHHPCRCPQRSLESPHPRALDRTSLLEPLPPLPPPPQPPYRCPVHGFILCCQSPPCLCPCAGLCARRPLPPPHPRPPACQSLGGGPTSCLPRASLSRWLCAPRYRPSTHFPSFPAPTHGHSLLPPCDLCCAFAHCPLCLRRAS